MRKVALGLLSSFVAVAVAHTILAEDARPSPNGPAEILQRLKAADVNHDGKLSKEEAPGRMKEHFDEIDANGDGQIEPAEFFQAVLKHLKAADANGDDKLSKDEAPEPLKSHFEKVDFNGDGFVDAVEIKKAFQLALGEKPGNDPRTKLLERLKAADANGDGQLSKDEAPEPLKSHFAQVDANGDGQIDKVEFKKALEAVHALAAKAIERLKAADANGDGKLSKDEAPEPLKSHFEKVDANGDGQIDKVEIKKAIDALHAKLAGQAK